MLNKITWLRFCYWVGAITDLLAAIQILSSNIFAATNKLPNFKSSVEFQFAAGFGASLMLGWTFLLLWADRKPVERKGILLITVFPVIVGLVINEILAVLSNFISLEVMIPIWILQAILSVLFIFSYFNARNANASDYRNLS